MNVKNHTFSNVITAYLQQSTELQWSRNNKLVFGDDKADIL